MRNFFLFLLITGSLTVYAQKGGAGEDLYIASETGLTDKSNRFTSLLAGLALAEDQPGVHIEFMKGFKAGQFWLWRLHQFHPGAQAGLFSLDHYGSAA